ncbi:MAG: hypothetical protein EXX96DRAFT_608236 [Benjaminiella poitrasii]|nr:MAG: hypothetical protein EXX96DRAFT_608236 [Benjaminiella poitrasii]
MHLRLFIIIFCRFGKYKWHGDRQMHFEGTSHMFIRKSKKKYEIHPHECLTFLVMLFAFLDTTEIILLKCHVIFRKMCVIPNRITQSLFLLTYRFNPDKNDFYFPHLRL